MRTTISDTAVILARTDYGEKDRILTLLTPDHGKLKAIAKGVRSGKSRLAGGIELFAENELSLAEGRGELYTVTFSRMKRYFGKIAGDIDASMYAYECLKAINKLAPDHAGGEHYDALVGLLAALDTGKIPLAQIKIWYGLKLLNNLGLSPNFKTDSSGRVLSPEGRYRYDFDRQCFITSDRGTYAPEHIKILRHLDASQKPVQINENADAPSEKAETLIGLILKDHLS